MVGHSAVDPGILKQGKDKKSPDNGIKPLAAI